MIEFIKEVREDAKKISEVIKKANEKFEKLMIDMIHLQIRIICEEKHPVFRTIGIANLMILLGEYVRVYGKDRAEEKLDNSFTVIL